MPIDAHVNGAYSTVSVAPSPATSGSTLSVSAGDGSIFPASGSYNICVWPNGQVFTKNNGEIIRVTGARSGDQLTGMTRAQEGTTARTVVVGDQVALAPTNAMFAEIENRLLPFWIPAAAFYPSYGTVAQLASRGGGTGVYNLPGWALDDGGIRANDFVNWWGTIPAGMVGKVVTPTIHMAVATANSGNWIAGQYIGYSLVSVVDNIDKAADVSTAAQTQSLGAGAAKLFYTFTMPTFTPTTPRLRYAFGRNGGSGSDNLTGDVWFLGVEFNIP